MSADMSKKPSLYVNKNAQKLGNQQEQRPSRLYSNVMDCLRKS